MYEAGVWSSYRLGETQPISAIRKVAIFTAYVTNGFFVHFPHPLAAVSAAPPSFSAETKGVNQPFSF
ncbi:MAG TPA: hypothetical protein DCQ76_05850 [Ruminococcaceae bacterium]|nr:hypothetical protein [Oscillospiraceae bacterium]